jgi:hypothetical protein
MITALKQLIAIAGAYAFMLATLCEKFPLIKMAAINILMTGRM